MRLIRLTLVPSFLCESAGAGCLFQAGIEVPGGGEAADQEGVMRGL
jgi:hypothetical protein